MTVELRQLRYFVAVAEAGQISAAARGLHLAQPALSHAMQTLERAVGVKLLVRHSRGVTLTPGGKRLLDGARETLDACERAVAGIRELAPAKRGVTLGANPITPGLGQILTGFRREHPDHPLRWVALSFDRDSRAVSDEEVDVALVVPEYPGTGTQMESLYALPAFVCAATDHPLASLKIVRFEDIADEVFPGQHPTVPDVFADLFYLTALRGYRPRTCPTMPLTPDETWAMLASGEAITTTPERAWSSCPEPMIVRPVIDAPPFVVRMMWRDDDNPATGLLVAYLRARYATGSTSGAINAGRRVAPHAPKRCLGS